MFLASAQQFQFPPLREGRQFGVTGDKQQFLFQFPPLREGRQQI